MIIINFTCILKVEKNLSFDRIEHKCELDVGSDVFMLTPLYLNRRYVKIKTFTNFDSIHTTLLLFIPFYGTGL